VQTKNGRVQQGNKEEVNIENQAIKGVENTDNMIIQNHL